MLLVRHLGRVAWDLGGYARVNGRWWLLPAVALLALVVALASATQAAVPYAVYTVF